MSLCIYSGGDSGFEERDALLSYLKTLDSRKYLVILSSYYNRPNNPPIPVLIRKLHMWYSKNKVGKPTSTPHTPHSWGASTLWALMRSCFSSFPLGIVCIPRRVLYHRKVRGLSYDIKKVPFMELSKGADQIRTGGYWCCRPLPYHLATTPCVFLTR